MAKAHVIRLLLENDLRQEQLVIWFRFNQELDAVAAYLRDLKYKVHTVKGNAHNRDPDAPSNTQKKKDFQSIKKKANLEIYTSPIL